MMSDRLWYAAYGSNIDRGRFECYLTGGQPEGATRVYPGCRDREPDPVARPLTLTGEMYFGWNSTVWGGGIAFFDGDRAGSVLAQGYLVTRRQFSDILAQEMRRPPGVDIDIDAAITLGSNSIGDGRYEKLLHCGDLDGHPILTFTSDKPQDPNAPSAGYLRTILRGVVESHRLDPADAARYLAARPGAEGWAIESIAALAQPATGERGEHADRAAASGVRPHRNRAIET